MCDLNVAILKDFMTLMYVRVSKFMLLSATGTQEDETTVLRDTLLQ